MKVLTETQPLIQSVLVKHKHPVLAFKKAKAIIKIYKCNKRLTMLHRKKLQSHVQLGKQRESTLPGGVLHTVTVPPCLSTLIRSKTGNTQQMKQPKSKEIFRKHPQNKSLTMYSSATLKTRGAKCKAGRVTKMEQAKQIHYTQRSKMKNKIGYH